MPKCLLLKTANLLVSPQQQNNQTKHYLLSRSLFLTTQSFPQFSKQKGSDISLTSSLLFSNSSFSPTPHAKYLTQTSPLEQTTPIPSAFTQKRFLSICFSKDMPLLYSSSSLTCGGGGKI